MINNWEHFFADSQFWCAELFGHGSMALMLVGRLLPGPARRAQARAHLSGWLAATGSPPVPEPLHTLLAHTHTLRTPGPFAPWSVKPTSHFFTSSDDQRPQTEWHLHGNTTTAAAAAASNEGSNSHSEAHYTLRSRRQPRRAGANYITVSVWEGKECFYVMVSACEERPNYVCDNPQDGRNDGIWTREVRPFHWTGPFQAAV